MLKKDLANDIIDAEEKSLKGVGIVAEKKEKRYVSDDARLMAEWDWEHNNNLGIYPQEITCGSNKKVWWLGVCGHIWEAQIKSRNNGRGCPICAGKIVLTGFNDLATKHPEVILEWDWGRNTFCLPTKIMSNSHIEVWWKCKNGHSWQASPNHRISKGRGCPYCCHNPQVLQGDNDLATIYPKIASEWHPTKNGSLQPSQVTSNSSQRVWWKCSKGHEWRTAVNHRANGSGCPKCAKSSQTSFPEQAVYFYVKQAYPDAINGYTELFNNHGMELDIYIPSMNIGVEYDGVAFHRSPKQTKRDLQKYSICKQNHVFLIRLREDATPIVEKNCDSVILVNKGLNAAVLALKKYLPKLVDADVLRDDALIRSMYYCDLEKNSLLHQHPDVARQWDYTRNGDLTPDMFKAHSNTSVWWVCSKNHRWEASIDSRVNGAGCPYCSNNVVLIGFNDLAYKRPDLAIEWDYSKNTFSPTSVTSGSGKRAWWICSACGHQWYAEISSRNKGAGCPACSKQKRKATKGTKQK